MSRRFLLLYASQTGQAEAIAKNEIHAVAEDHELSPAIFCMSQTEKKFNIEKETVAVFVVSTTGDGDPPDTAQKFWRRLKKKTLAKSYLQHLKFAVLGLGDSNYTNFCNFSRMLNKRLLELGATDFYDTGYADDAVGLERVVEPWTDGLWSALKKVLNIVERNDKSQGLIEDKSAAKRVVSKSLSSPPQDKKVTTSEGQSSSVDSSPMSGRRDLIAAPQLQKVSEPVRNTATNKLGLSIGVNKSKTKPSPQKSPVTVTVSGAGPQKSSGSDNETVTVASDKSLTTEKKEALKPATRRASAINKSQISWQFGGAGKGKDRSPTSKQMTGSSLPSPTVAKSVKEDSTRGSVVVNGTVNGELKQDMKKKGRRRSDGGSAVALPKSVDSTDGATSEHKEVDVIAALRKSNPALEGVLLTLPVVPRPFLKVNYSKGLLPAPELTATKKYASSYPSQAASVFMAPITACQQLTRDDAVKTALEVELDSKGSGVTYTPGDSFSIVCENDVLEVEWLINRLGLESKADVTATLAVLEGTQAIDPAVPVHLPKSWTARGWLHNCCDIRSVPKKMFLRQLAECTSDIQEKNRIQQLCSRQGSFDFASVIREQHASFLDVMEAFPSCKPTLSMVLEGLPRLQPRAYSVASSPLSIEDKVKFVFNIVNLPPRQTGGSRKGLCTGWLERLSHHFRQTFEARDQPSPSVANPPTIPIFLRVNNRFKIPEDFSVPLLMIGPGTGIAPFVGFLQHRHEQQMAAKATGMRKLKFGETWLFFGCRHRERDFLYEKKLEDFVSCGTLSHLHVAFSRDAGQPANAPKYVQHNLKRQGAALTDLILKQNASIFVCGDAKNMAKDVMRTLSEILTECSEMTASEAKTFLASLREDKRYCEDVWT